ncbi:MAG: hypothetical protein HC893_00005 [Chloroflexaceae bacterium]|nr:hypothetical protein [Chloroflexaceae bacterium]
MPLSDMIAAARQREADRRRAIEEARRTAEMQQFEVVVRDAFGGTFVQDISGQIDYGEQPVLRVGYEGSTYDITLSRNQDGSRSWKVADRRVFDQGRIEDQQERIDRVVLALAELVQAGQVEEPLSVAPQTQRLD